MPAYARQIIRDVRHPRVPPSRSRPRKKSALMAVFQKSFGCGSSFQDSVKDALHGGADLAAVPVPDREQQHAGAGAARRATNWRPSCRTSCGTARRIARRCKLAASGTLRKQLDAEVERMIADPRFSRFVQEFASQWLSLDKFQVLEPDRKQFPKLTRDTRTAASSRSRSSSFNT